MNLVSADPLRADDQGVQLRVGREKEARWIIDRLINSDGHIFIGGDPGVGKTSLANNVAFELAEETHRRSEPGTVFIMAEGPIHVESSSTAESIRNEFYALILKSIQNNDAILPGHVKTRSKIRKLSAWLDTPMLRSGQVTVGIQPVTLGGGGGWQANTSAGFARHGFSGHVDAILDELHESGVSLICMMDNLERIGKVGDASRLLEDVRDSILSARAVKWIVCGAGGVSVAVQKPSLAGKFGQPILLEPLEGGDFQETFLKRMSGSANALSHIELPSTIVSTFLERAGGNVRDAFRLLESFRGWLIQLQNEMGVSLATESIDDEDWRSAVEDFMSQYVEDYDDLLESLSDSVITTLLRIHASQKSVLLGDYSSFGVERIEDFIDHCDILEASGFLVKFIKLGNREPAYMMTCEGFLVAEFSTVEKVSRIQLSL
ncbi:hypothetical protein SAMN04487849_10512 [Micrococcus luteus]|uniref:ATP-binding protein n=2 Tax=Micrococcus luteus TaxID=1270 RepID=A0ABD7M7D5_MICLU|nr:hypothetical protein SAMN04487849_10512 [Micrococcus luteus]